MTRLLRTALTRTPRALAMFACVATSGLLAAHPAHAQSITAQVASQQAYVGEPTRVSISITDAPQFEGPFIDEVEGLEIARLAGEQTSTRLEFINGRRSESRTVSIAYELTARRTGQFLVPAFSITVDGKTLSTKPFRLTALVSETGDLLLASITCAPSTMYVGQEGSLNLEIAVKRYREEKLSITLDEASMWSLIGRENSSWGAFGPALQKMLSENRRPRGETRVIGDIEYIVFTIAKPFDPIAPGAPSVGEVRIRMDYPTKLARGNDMFFENRLSLAGSRPISAVATVTAADVRSPPEGGRPASWNGAVGAFEIEAIAKPVDVAVGDPITLTIRLTDTSGVAALSGLQAPPIADLPGFMENFRVPREAAAGTLDGRDKVFTQSLRASNDRVRAIPPIAFSFFNPTSGTYETATTEPISITVRPSAVAKLHSDHALGTTTDSSSAFTKVEGGLVAGASADECASSSTISVRLLATTALVPLAAAVLPFVLARTRRIRHAHEERKRSARHDFLHERSHGSLTDPDNAERALLGYIAARTGASSEGFTRRNAIDQLARQLIDSALLASSEEFLRQCERARYSATAIDDQALRALVEQLEVATANASLSNAASVQSESAAP